MEAIRRGELDVAFGRVHDLAQPWPGELRKRLVQLEPYAAIVGADHPLAGQTAICPRELRTSTLWAPPITTAPEMLTWFEHFTHDFHIPIRYREPSWIPNVEEQARFAGQHPDSVGIVPAQTTRIFPPSKVIALTAPVPRIPWSMVWRRDDRNPELAKFLHVVFETSTAQRWTVLDHGSDWIPEPDRADFTAGAQFGQ
jgi:DNA-binding transcriptional LysR family regulator